MHHRGAGDGAGLCSDAAAGDSGQYKEQKEQNFSAHGRGPLITFLQFLIFFFKRGFVFILCLMCFGLCTAEEIAGAAPDKDGQGFQ